MLERDAQARMPKARILLERAADILPGLAGLRQNDKRERARKVGSVEEGGLRSVLKLLWESALAAKQKTKRSSLTRQKEPLGSAWEEEEGSRS